MKQLRNLILSIVSVVALGLASPAPALAWSPFGGVDCSGAASDSAICNERRSTDNPVTGRDGLILRIANIIAVIGGAAAVIIIILAGLRFVTASGSAEDVSGARRTLIYALVGLVIIVLARTLVAFTINRIPG